MSRKEETREEKARRGRGAGGGSFRRGRHCSSVEELKTPQCLHRAPQSKHRVGWGWEALAGGDSNRDGGVE